MMAWLEQLAFWHWWMLAGLMLLLEMWAPTYFFLWVGISAAAVGFLCLVVPGMSIEIQLLVFAACTLFAVMGWYRHRDKSQA